MKTISIEDVKAKSKYPKQNHAFYSRYVVVDVEADKVVDGGCSKDETIRITELFNDHETKYGRKPVYETFQIEKEPEPPYNPEHLKWVCEEEFFDRQRKDRNIKSLDKKWSQGSSPIMLHKIYE